MSSSKFINLKINDIPVSVKPGTKIINAAESIGVHIPRLCYHPNLPINGSCRICIVEQKGSEFFIPSCSTDAVEGMILYTNSKSVREARRDIMELILDNHDNDCQKCWKNTNCQLQKTALLCDIKERIFTIEKKEEKIDDSGISITFDKNKCILCGRCISTCNEIQGVYNLDQQKRGFKTIVAPAFCKDFESTECVQCGQCINVCPTGALKEKNHITKVLNALNKKNKHVIVQTAPAIRAALGEEFGFPVGTQCSGKMVSALKRIGFSKVFDTNFAADLTIIEEATELLDRIKNNGPLPLITSCSPGWINFMEKFFPDFIKNTSSCKSPMSMLSSIIKTYYAEKMKISPESIFNVAIMPCVAKKFEAERQEHMINNMRATDACLTTRELAWLIKSYGINFSTLPDTPFDSPLGESSGAGTIFGASGGVMEAALRTLAVWITNDKKIKISSFKEARFKNGIKEISIDIKDIKINVAIINGLANAKKFLKNLSNSKKKYHAIEIMACPGGCIGGGGQPFIESLNKDDTKKILKKRAKALYGIDNIKDNKFSHENKDIKKLYSDFLKEPCGKISHKILHTTYKNRSKKGS